MNELLAVVGVTVALCLVGVFMCLAAVMIVSQWVITAKAGFPGWSVLIPVYATFIQLRVIRRPESWGWIIVGTSFAQFCLSIYEQFVLAQPDNQPWWLLLSTMILSIVLAIYGVRMTHGYARVFGKTGWFTVGLIFIPYVFYPILAFGNAPYQPDGMVYNSFGPG